MNVKRPLLWISFTALLFVTPFSISKAEAPTPGSVEDPVITKSYFDKNTLTEAKVKELIQQNSNNSSNNSNTLPSSASSSIQVIQLKNGQTLYAGAGAEFIVRTGRAIAVSNDENGIPDVTAGKDIAAGVEVATNHLLIFPREGRGIKPAAKNTAEIFVMVRGSYLLLNADGSTATP